MQPTIQYIRNELNDLYSPQETGQITRLIFHALRGYTLTDMVLRSGEILTPGETARVKKIVSRLRKHEPIQYVLGHTLFYGLTLKVTPSVLIPRPETEELVDWIISERQESPSGFLDIGTGSGCIALALQKAFPAATGEGCDISENALAVARENGRSNNLGVTFFKADILNSNTYPHWNSYDLIVSNPPYVTQMEKSAMQSRVTDHEPGTALFVPDEDPLLFYRHIADFAIHHLNKKGNLFFEINQQFGTQVVTLLRDLGYTSVELRNDLQGVPRMIKAVAPG